MSSSLTAVSVLVALSLSGALAGSWVGPASAAPGQVCYFGACVGNSAPVPAPCSQAIETRILSKHGSWTAVVVGGGAMIVNELEGGAKFGVLAYPDARLSLLLSHPEWRLTKGQSVEMIVRIDGKTFKRTAAVNDKGFLEADGVGKDLVIALYRGRTGEIEVGKYRFDMTSLADAAAAIDSLMRYRRNAAC